jgi:hypothetical protein
VYTDKSRGEGEGVYFRLVPGTSTPKVCPSIAAAFPDGKPALLTPHPFLSWQVSITVSFPDGKPALPVELPTEATVSELMCLVAVKRHVCPGLALTWPDLT